MTVTVPGPRTEQTYQATVGTDHRVLPPGLVGLRDFIENGVTYRKLDYWTRTGILHTEVPARGSGSVRVWPESEIAVAVAIVRLREHLGLSLEQAAKIARCPGGTRSVSLASGITLMLDENLWRYVLPGQDNPTPGP